MAGKQYPLAQYAGKVAVVVNVASQCGWTKSNYEGLQFLWDKYRDYGFTVLGFPCNQFGGQEPGSNDDIKAFAAREYGITFPLFSKVEVNGPNASPIFTFLRNNSQNLRDTQWNFEK
eukprot:jgi/Astpho2/886/gw1.00016.270.1_t